MTTRVIAIGGMSGAGKTALAAALAARLPGGCAVVGLDSYYHPLDHLPPAERAACNFDHPSALDWALLAAHLDALQRGRPVRQPVYLFDRHTRAAETRVVDPRPYLIVEGILALHSAEVRGLAHVKLFVAAAEEECLRRRLQRDLAERGRSQASVLEQYRATVLPMAREFVLPSAAHADLIVSGEQPLEQSVARAFSLCCP
jgi:uridine kinase